MIAKCARTMAGRSRRPRTRLMSMAPLNVTNKSRVSMAAGMNASPLTNPMPANSSATGMANDNMVDSPNFASRAGENIL